MKKVIPAQVEPDSTWSLATWLDYLLSIHPKNIEMGLDRVQLVFDKLNLDLTGSTIVSVAGTNGKGTTCALIEHAVLASGKSVAVYSSPHLINYQERVRINHKQLSASAHCNAFLRIEEARGDVLLTFFEFATLAALYLISKHTCEIVLLEVGLGGRLDAVNIVDPDLAVITSIGIDHQEFLGDTRELIAIEKAGIFRKGIPAVIGEIDPPDTLIEQANNINVSSYWQGKDFNFVLKNGSWNWSGKDKQLSNLPLPLIPLQNVSTALQVIELLRLPLSSLALRKVIENTSLPGRYQKIQTDPTVILDVAHNPQAANNLVAYLNSLEFENLHLVVAMLADKDIKATLEPFIAQNAQWYMASLDNPRGADSELLKSVLNKNETVLEFESVEKAYNQALSVADKKDLVVVFGSFFTVANVLKNLN